MQTSAIEGLEPTWGRGTQARRPERPEPCEVHPELAITIQILVAARERAAREGSAALLQSLGYSVTTVGDGEEALALARQRRFDVMLLDEELPPRSGMEILRTALATHPQTLVVMLSADPSVARSIAALREGAWDYVPRALSASHLELLTGRAAHEIFCLQRAVGSAPAHMVRALDPEELLIGTAPAFMQALEIARKVAPTDAPVMIHGESGTGKRLVGRYIYRRSRRANGVLLPVSCGALTDAELVGRTAPGALAGEDDPGLLAVAMHGTVYLEDLAELAPRLQTKLARVLRTGRARRLGDSTRLPAPVDVRFISGLEVDPAEAVRHGLLRRELVRALGLVTIALPPLRERPGDIVPLAEHFLAYWWTRYRQPDEPLPRLSPAAGDWLRSLPWGGNVRQLRNVMEHLAVIVAPESEVQPADIPLVSRTASASAAGGIYAAIMDDAYGTAKQKLLRQFEREYLPRLFERAGNNIARAARLARMDRTTLYRLMEKHGARREELEDTA